MGDTTVRNVHLKGKSSGFGKMSKELEDVNKKSGILMATQDKLEKGVSSMGKNSTANFAKMSQGLGGLVHVYATVAANVFALSAAFLVLRQTMDVDIMISSAEQLSQSTGISYANVAKSMKDVTQGALSMQEALRSASIGISSGLSGKQMEDIAEIATKAANALGRSVPEAINRMTQAVVKNEPELVDEYGIILRVDSALKEYADSLGKTKAELTSFDKQMAIHAQLVKQGETKFGNVEGQVNAYNKLGAAFQEMTHSLISFLNDGLGPLANLLAENSGLLAGLFALFAKSVFAKAVPEVKNLTASLAAQREEYTKLIAEKEEELSVISIDKPALAESKLKGFDTVDIAKKSREIFKGMDFKVLEEELGESTAKGLKAGTEGGLRSLKALSPSFKKEIGGLVEQATISKSIEARVEAQKMLKTKGLTVETAHQLLTLNKAINKEIKLGNLDLDQTLNKSRSIQEQLQTRLITQQKHSLEVKKARSAAFGAGATGGFLGGGLAAANQSIAENLSGGGKTFGVVEKSSLRIAGIFGNISGLLGGIMSLVSGWGIALYVISQVALPIADAIGLTSKAAREAEEAIESAAEDMKTLQENAEELSKVRVESLGESIANVNAKANNLTEQIDTITSSINNLKDLSSFSLFGDSDLKEGIQNIENMALDAYGKQGLNIPVSFIGDVESINKANVALQKSKDLVKKLKDEREKTDRGSTERKQIEHSISIEHQKQVTAIDNIGKKVKELHKPLLDNAQALRDSADVMSNVNRSLDEMASSQAKASSEFKKSSPYYKQLEDLENIEKKLADNNIKKGEFKDILKRVNELSGRNLKDEADLNKYIKDQTKLKKKALNNDLKGKLEEVKIKTKSAELDAQMAEGDPSAVLTSEKIDLNNTLTAIKLRNLKIAEEEVTELFKTVKTGEEIVDNAFALQKIQADINDLTSKNRIENDNTLNSYKDQTVVLDRRIAILGSEKSILDSSLTIAKMQSDISKEYNTERLKAINEVSSINVKILKLQKEANNHKEKEVENDKAILALRAKKLVIEQKMTQEFSKQLEAIAKNKATLDIKITKAETATVIFDTQAAKLRNKLEQELNDIASLRPITVAEEYNALEKIINLKKEILKKELLTLSGEHAVTAAKRNKAKLEAKAAKVNGKGLEREKALLQTAKLNLELQDIQNERLELQKQYEEDIYEIQLQKFELAKKKTTADTIFEDPEGFTKLLGKEFAILSKEFSDSVMDPVTRASDSILRIMDTATDTLHDAIAAGENVGQAIWDAIKQTADDITAEITKDIMKQWSRYLMADLFGIESTAEQSLRAERGTESNTAIMAGKTDTPEKKETDNIFTKAINSIKDFFGLGSDKEIKAKEESTVKTIDNAKIVAKDSKTSIVGAINKMSDRLDSTIRTSSSTGSKTENYLESIIPEFNIPEIVMPEIAIPEMGIPTNTGFSDMLAYLKESDNKVDILSTEVTNTAVTNTSNMQNNISETRSYFSGVENTTNKTLSAVNSIGDSISSFESTNMVPDAGRPDSYNIVNNAAMTDAAQKLLVIEKSNAETNKTATTISSQIEESNSEFSFFRREITGFGIDKEDTKLANKTIEIIKETNDDGIVATNTVDNSINNVDDTLKNTYNLLSTTATSTTGSADSFTDQSTEEGSISSILNSPSFTNILGSGLGDVVGSAITNATGIPALGNIASSFVSDKVGTELINYFNEDSEESSNQITNNIIKNSASTSDSIVEEGNNSLISSIENQAIQGTPANITDTVSDITSSDDITNILNKTELSTTEGLTDIVGSAEKASLIGRQLDSANTEKIVTSMVTSNVMTDAGDVSSRLTEGLLSDLNFNGLESTELNESIFKESLDFNSNLIDSSAQNIDSLESIGRFITTGDNLLNASTISGDASVVSAINALQVSSSVSDSGGSLLDTVVNLGVGFLGGGTDVGGGFMATELSGVDASSVFSLDSLDFAAFAVGTDKLSQDGLAMLHKNEAIIPAKQNPAFTGTSILGKGAENFFAKDFRNISTANTDRLINSNNTSNISINNKEESDSNVQEIINKAQDSSNTINNKTQDINSKSNEVSQEKNISSSFDNATQEITNNIPNNSVSHNVMTSFAVGTDKLSQDGLAMLHKNEAIIPAKQNPAFTGIGFSDSNDSYNNQSENIVDKSKFEEFTLNLSEFTDRLDTNINTGLRNIIENTDNSSEQYEMFNNVESKLSSNFSSALETYNNKLYGSDSINYQDMLSNMVTNSDISNDISNSFQGNMEEYNKNIETIFSKYNTNIKKEEDNSVLNEIIQSNSNSVQALNLVSMSNTKGFDSMADALSNMDIGSTDITAKEADLFDKHKNDFSIKSLGINSYLNGAVTNGPELAMIGDNQSGKEAVVPLPSGEQIPVEFLGDTESGDTVYNTTINVMGTDTNNADSVRRSAGQVALAASNSLNRAQNRNG